MTIAPPWTPAISDEESIVMTTRCPTVSEVHAAATSLKVRVLTGNVNLTLNVACNSALMTLAQLSAPVGA